MKKEISKFRVNFFGAPSFWVAQNTEENKQVLLANGIVFSVRRFIAADGRVVNRLEWND